MAQAGILVPPLADILYELENNPVYYQHLPGGQALPVNRATHTDEQ